MGKLQRAEVRCSIETRKPAMAVHQSIGCSARKCAALLRRCNILLRHLLRRRALQRAEVRCSIETGIAFVR